MSRTLVLAAALLLAAPATLAGQQSPARVTVAGQVLDRQSREPIPGAMVRAEGGEGTTGTDTDGRFRLEVREGEHMFSVSRLGYTELRAELELSRQTGTVTFMLDARPALLEGVTVVFDRIERRRQRLTVSSQVLDRSALLSRGGSLADIVMRSGLFVRGSGCDADYCVAHRGGAVEPVVFIDDIVDPAGMRALEAFSPEIIERVEVYERGLTVRAYTAGYLERVASGRARLRPILRF